MSLAWIITPSQSHRAYSTAPRDVVGFVTPRRFYDDQKGFDVYAVVGPPTALVRWFTWLGHFAELEPARWRLEEHAASTGTETASDPVQSLI